MVKNSLGEANIHVIFICFVSEVKNMLGSLLLKTSLFKSIKILVVSFQINFYLILDPKIDEKGCWKNHEKTMTTKMAKKSNPGEEVRGGVNHSSREVGGSWKVELDG